MHFIKKIFCGQCDELVHEQFVRFGKGEYVDRAAISIKISGSKISAKSGFEYCNDFIKFFAEHSNGPFDIEGKIFSKKKIESKFAEGYEKKRGLYVASINKKLSKKELEEIYETFKFHYILCNLSCNEGSLKMDKKPHNPRGKYKEDFCKLKLNKEIIKDFLEEFAFDIRDFKNAAIKHDITIDSVDTSKCNKDDYEDIRINAKRCGIIKRVIDVDGKKIEKETKLEA